jgi:hypothetical protein
MQVVDHLRTEQLGTGKVTVGEMEKGKENLTTEHTEDTEESVWVLGAEAPHASAP